MTATWWSPGQILSSPVAIDTETRLIEDDLDVPDLALLVACDGGRVVLVHPDDVAGFLLAHRRHRYYAYNASFDFWVLAKALAATPAARVLWDAADQNRLTCLRMLWRLIRLATTGVPAREGTLADAAVEQGVEPVPDKEDPYRLRYCELIGLSRAQIDAHPEAGGFKGYALVDARATHALIEPMTTRTVSLMKLHGFGKAKNYTIRPDALARWGPLSACLQTRADIVLAQLSREPLRIDAAQLGEMEADLRQRLAALADQLEDQAPGLWDRYKKTGERKLNPTSYLPKRKQNVLEEKLRAVAAGCGKPVLTTAKGEVSLSSKDWHGSYQHPFVAAWNEYELAKKRLSTMLLPMKAGVIYADYEVLKKTGRTSASKHRRLPSIPVQQVPRSHAVRSLFLADKGCERLTIDYSYLELRTLAAWCLGRFGQSKLAEVVRRHTEAVRRGEKDVLDPHEWMTALSMGLTPEQFFALPAARQKELRQRAKVANFGLPGGLGVQRTIEYARDYPGADGKPLQLSVAEARALKQQWLAAFPEMSLHLADNTLANLAANLHTTPGAVAARFVGDLWQVREAVQGYLPEEKARPVVEALFGLCRNRGLLPLLGHFDYSAASHEVLAGALITGVACTLTGLIRGGVGYCDGANLPFQGLAAAGAKEALWKLLFAGYRVKAFIHDEILVDLPAGLAEALRPRIHQILDEAMEAVMGHGVPSLSVSHLGSAWTKA